MSIGRYSSSPATTERNEHGEGPCWDARTGRLLWIDQYAGLVIVGEWDAAARRLSPVRRYDLGSPVGAVAPARSGGWITASRHGFSHLAVDGTQTMLAQPEDAAPVRVRMNDGKCDDLGRFWAGSMGWDKQPGAGTFYRLDPDLSVTVVLRDVTISNGLAWSDDGTELYYIDTPTRRVDRFRVDAEGALHDREAVVRIPEDAGQPDGMCIDVEGCLWVALWDGHAVHRYSPAGELLAVVDVDAPQVSSCCFGGPDGDTLFITTSQEGMDAARRAKHVQSGKVFAADVEMSGRPAAEFAAPWP